MTQKLMVCLIFTGAQSSQQLIVASRTPAASEYIFTFRRSEKKEEGGKKQHHEKILPHHMNMQGLDTSSVIANVAANYRACHDTVIHEYSSLTDIDGSSMQRPPFPFYCLIVNGGQVPPSCHGGAFQLQDKLFHKALLVNSVLYKGV